MIGYLPTTLEVAGKEYSICSDYRVALVIFEAFDDPELNEYDKMAVMLDCLYKEPDSIPREACNEAIEKASWFLDGGEDYKEVGQQRQKKVMSWSQDEKMIFSAVNKTAGQEVRAVPYMHWWTFLGYFAEIGECFFSTVRSIREKKNRHKKLDKWEQEFYKEHKKMIDIERKYSAQEQAERDALNKLLG
jgi:hypothetical protein|nr:MAG TPA: hypothetical protein [Caudoviricetes sp.]